MGIDTKPNFSSNRFEQCSGDTMNLSGCTQIFGIFDMESGSTLSICAGAGAGKVLTTTGTSGIAIWQTPNVYDLNSPATCTVGGVSPGYILTGKSLSCIIQDAFAPYIEPAFSVFNVGITPQPLEVGASMGGNKTFTWTTSTPDNVTAASIGICEVGGDLLGSGLVDDSTHSLDIGTLTNTSPTTYTWQITGSSTQDTAFSRNVSKCSVYPYFYGVVTSGSRPDVTIDIVTGGTKVVSAISTSVGVTFNSSNQYTWYAQPTICDDRAKWFIAVGNCGFVDRAVPSDRYPDKCVLDITSPNECWSAISYEVYMSDYADTLSDPLYFRTY